MTLLCRKLTIKNKGLKMGREVRMVPKDWQHPKYDNGNFIPLFDGGFDEIAAEWDAEKERWDSGIYPDYADEENKKKTYEEWAGERPKKEDYMPEFPEGTATYLMMYENTLGGTPISPAFETPEELAQWLYDKMLVKIKNRLGKSLPRTRLIAVEEEKLNGNTLHSRLHDQ